MCVCRCEREAGGCVCGAAAAATARTPTPNPPPNRHPPTDPQQTDPKPTPKTDPPHPHPITEDRFYNDYPAIIMTAKGQPDVASRLFLRKLKTTLKIPVLALVDADPCVCGWVARARVCVLCVWGFFGCARVRCVVSCWPPTPRPPSAHTHTHTHTHKPLTHSYGLKILAVYMKGSMNMSYDSSNLTTPDIKVCVCVGGRVVACD